MVKDQERPATRHAVESDETCPAAPLDSAPSSCESSPRNSAVGGRGVFPQRSDSAGSQGPHTPSEESFYSSGAGSSQESIVGLPFLLDELENRRGGDGGGDGGRAPPPRHAWRAGHTKRQALVAGGGRRAQENLDPSDASRSLRPADDGGGGGDDGDVDDGSYGGDFDGVFVRLFGLKLGVGGASGASGGVGDDGASGAGTPPESPLGFEGYEASSTAAVALPPAVAGAAAGSLERGLREMSLGQYCQEPPYGAAGLDESPVAFVGSPDFVQSVHNPHYYHQQQYQQQQQYQHYQQQQYQQQQQLYQPQLYDHQYQLPQGQLQQYPHPLQHPQQIHCQQQPQQQYPAPYNNHQQFSVSPLNSQPASPQHAPPGFVVGGAGGCAGGTRSAPEAVPPAVPRPPCDGRCSSLGLSRLEPPAPLVSHAEAGGAQAVRARPAAAEAYSPRTPPVCSPAGGTRTESIVLPDRQRKIFVTYSLDSDAHIKRVISFVTWLRQNGFNTELDIFDTLLQVMSKTEWMDRFLNDKDYLIVIIISPKYKRDTDTPSGSDEHGLHTHYIHQQIKNEYIQNGSKNFRLVPVLFPGANKGHVPSWLNNTIVYAWPENQADLMLRLCRREKYEIPPPGPLPVIVAHPFGSQ